MELPAGLIILMRDMFRSVGLLGCGFEVLGG